MCQHMIKMLYPELFEQPPPTILLWLINIVLHREKEKRDYEMR